MSSVKEATMNALEGHQLTRMHGRPSRQAVKTTRMEIARVYAATKTTHKDFPLGDRFGYAAAILKSKTFIRHHNKECADGDELADDWDFIIPQRPAATDPTLGEAENDAARRKKEHEWKEHQDEFARFDAHETVFREKLAAAYDPEYFQDLRDKLRGFSHICVEEMLQHLLKKCLALTDKEKETRLKATEKPWDQNREVSTYFQDLCNSLAGARLGSNFQISPRL